MLEQRHHVGERFVERGHIRVGLILVVPVQTIEQSVRGLVRYHVMGEATEDESAR